MGIHNRTWLGDSLRDVACRGRKLDPGEGLQLKGINGGLLSQKTASSSLQGLLEKKIPGEGRALSFGQPEGQRGPYGRKAYHKKRGILRYKGEIHCWEKKGD